MSRSWVLALIPTLLAQGTIYEPCPPCPVPAPPVICQQDVQDGAIVSPENLPSIHSRHNMRRETKQHVTRARKNDVYSCNSAELKRIMLESIHDDILVAKIAIVNRAAVEIGGHFDAVCATGKFSYFAVARLFCEATSGDVSCFAFRHDDITGQNLPKLVSMPELGEKEERAEEDIPLEIPRSPRWSTTSTPLTSLTKVSAEHETTVAELVETSTTEPLEADESASEEANEEQDAPSMQKRSGMESPQREISLEDAQTQGLREETMRELEQQSNKKTINSSELELLKKVLHRILI